MAERKAYFLEEKVYVQALDVFGKVVAITYDKGAMTYGVECEMPLPDFMWYGTAEKLVPESRYR